MKSFDSDRIHSLGWMIEALLFVGKKKKKKKKELFSQLPSPLRRIDKNQPFALQRLTSI